MSVVKELHVSLRIYESAYARSGHSQALRSGALGSLHAEECDYNL